MEVKDMKKAEIDKLVVGSIIRHRGNGKEFKIVAIEEQYKLMETLEGKNLGQQEGNKDTIESITNILLEVTTIVAKMLRII